MVNVSMKCGNDITKILRGKLPGVLKANEHN